MKYITFEPVRSLAALLALGEAVIAALVFGLDLSTEAATVIGGVWVALVALLASFVVREKVTPVASTSPNPPT